MDSRTTRLLHWYRDNARNLPWRETDDAYHIFISELMLQQTQVDRVIPKYQAFFKQFPTWKTLANAKTDQLIHAWAGLGYNRRVLYARDAAKDVVVRGVPRSEEEWRLLKGVGPYMAAVLTEFVDHKRALAIDTNVRRVVGRLALGISFPQLEDDERILNALDKLTPNHGNHWILPHAFMDFGSLICTSRTPQCAACPFKVTCKSAKSFLNGTALKKSRPRVTERMYGEKKYPDRIYRGKILALIRLQGPQLVTTLGERIDTTYDPIADQDWIREIAKRLVKDGLLEWKTKNVLALPKS